MTKYIVSYRHDTNAEPAVLVSTWVKIGVGELDILGKIAMTRLEYSVFREMLDTGQVEKSGKFMKYEIQKGEGENA